MPVSYRKWFIQRLTDEYNQKADSRKKVEERKNSRTRVKDLPMGEMGQQSVDISLKTGPKSFK